MRTTRSYQEQTRMISTFARIGGVGAVLLLVHGGAAAQGVSAREALHSSAVASVMDEQRAHELAERMAALFEAMAQPTSAQYVALLTSWGGRWRLDPAGPDMQRGLGEGWHAPGEPCAFADVQWDAADFRLVNGYKPDGVTFNPPPQVRRPSSVGGVSFCMFNFGEGSTDALVRAGGAVAEVDVPVTLTDGRRIYLCIRFVDDPAAGWVPWTLLERPEQGNLVCERLF
ncbi:MAG: hypothetical protein SFZ24_08145 [Planctomycetota bacterium]|nr:hypothetical protein [Planctomycetota bacterium]